MQALHVTCIPVVPVASLRLSWKIPWIAVATTVMAGKIPSMNVAIQLPRMAAECRGNCCGFTSAKLQWQFPRTSVGCHRWYNGVFHGQNHGTCRGHNRGICRGSAMSRDPCRGNPQISTVARGDTHGSPHKCRGNCRGLPSKSEIVCVHAAVVACKGSKQRPQAARAEAARVGRCWPSLDFNSVTLFVQQCDRVTC